MLRLGQSFLCLPKQYRSGTRIETTDFKDDKNGKSGIAYLHQTAPEGSVATIPSSAIHTAGQGPLCSELSHQ